MVLQVSMGCFMTFFTALIDHLPNPVDLPCPPSVIQNLRRLLTTVKSRMNADEVPAVAFVLFVSRLGDDTVFSPLSLNEDRQIWWKCDVTRGEGAQSCDVQSGCAAIGSSDLEMCAQVRPASSFSRILVAERDPDVWPCSASSVSASATAAEVRTTESLPTPPCSRLRMKRAGLIPSFCPCPVLPPAHQKTDWKKRHRAVCTKPSW